MSAFEVGQFIGGMFNTGCWVIVTIAAGRYLGWW